MNATGLDLEGKSLKWLRDTRAKWAAQFQRWGCMDKAVKAAIDELDAAIAAHPDYKNRELEPISYADKPSS